LNGTGNLGIDLQMGNGTWQIWHNCHGNPATYESGTLPPNAATVQFVTTYRPDLAVDTPDPGTVINTATTPQPLTTTQFGGLTTRTVNGNTGSTWETDYQVQAIIRDSAGNVIMNSTCTLRGAIAGSA
jgi:hypothetical protein